MLVLRDAVSVIDISELRTAAAHIVSAVLELESQPEAAGATNAIAIFFLCVVELSGCHQISRFRTAINVH